MKPAVLAALVTVLYSVPLGEVHAKIPGATHCYNDICHRVKTLAETAEAAGMVERVLASFYDHPDVDRFNPGLMTSSGATFDPGSVSTVASPILPDGSVILIRNPMNGRAAVVRVTDGGPYYGKRTLDLARGLADALETRKAGVVELELTVLRAPSLDESTYKSKRIYAPVPGPIGTHETLASAQVFASSGQLDAQAVAHIVTASIDVKPQLLPERSQSPSAAERTPMKPASPRQNRREFATPHAVVPSQKASASKAVRQQDTSGTENFIANMLNRADAGSRM